VTFETLETVYFETTFDAALVPPQDIGDGIGGQESFGARFCTVRLRQKWSG
jgi:hypothetical protein